MNVRVGVNSLVRHHRRNSLQSSRICASQPKKPFDDVEIGPALNLALATPLTPEAPERTFHSI